MDIFVCEVVKIVRVWIIIVSEVVKNVRENIPTWPNDLLYGFFHR